MNLFKECIAVAAITISLPIVSWTNAATIGVTTTKDGLSRIAVEGPIEKGDYERFLEAVLSAGVDINTVSLATGGGDAREAMRLGRLIRAFGLSVEAGKHFPQGNFCLPEPKNPANCRCDSACLFLYLGGIHRYGDAIGVHRVYLNHEAQLQLSLDESNVISRAIEAETRKYFDEMGAPVTLLDQVNAAASDQVRYLTTEYVEQNLYGYSRDFEEWLIARCGSASRAFTRFYQNANARESEKALAEYTKVKACFNYHLRAERLKKFRPVLIRALAAVDSTSTKAGSLLATATTDLGAELPDIIGMPKSKAVRVLTTFGLGLIDAVSLKNGEGYHLRRSLIVSLSDGGFVDSVTFGLFGEPEDDLLPFTGYFLNGLSQESTPADFIAKYGKPWKQGQMPSSSTDMLWFEGSKYDLQVIFNFADNKLRSVSFNKRGYWKSLGR